MTMREEFEVFYFGAIVPPDERSRRDNGDYIDPAAQRAWEMWQAARKSTPQ